MISVFENFITDEEIEVALQNIKNSNVANHNSLYGDAQSSHQFSNYQSYEKAKEKGYSITVPHENILIRGTSIYNRIVNELNEYTRLAGSSDKMDITNSWFNIQRPGSHLNVHNHPNSELSGALYLKADSKSSRLIFEHKLIKPSVGMLVIFPSWMNHSGNNNQSEERIVISFNSAIKNI
jgi:hypothetical protein